MSGNQNAAAHRETPQELEAIKYNNELAEKILWAKGEGQFMVAIWVIEDDPTTPGRRVVKCYFQRRNGFPIGDFNAAGRMLRAWMQEEVQRETGAAPEEVKLPAAPAESPPIAPAEAPAAE